MKKLKKISLTREEFEKEMSLNEQELSKILGGIKPTMPPTYSESTRPIRR